MQLIIFVLATVAWTAGLIAAPSGAGTMEFYSASAQIIPVLLLVLAVEARIFESPWGWDFRSATLMGFSGFINVLVVLAFLLLAELEALSPLMTGKLSDGRPAVVVGGLAAGFVSVVAVALLPRSPMKVGRRAPAGRTRDPGAAETHPAEERSRADARGPAELPDPAPRPADEPPT